MSCSLRSGGGGSGQTGRRGRLAQWQVAEPSLSVVVEWGCRQAGGSGSPWVGEELRSERTGRAKAGWSPRVGRWVIQGLQEQEVRDPLTLELEIFIP